MFAFLLEGAFSPHHRECLRSLDIRRDIGYKTSRVGQLERLLENGP